MPSKDEVLFMNKKHLSFIVVVLLCLGLVVSACGKKPEAGESQPYVIGGVFSITGSNSPLGEPEKNSMNLFVDMINEKGGIDGHPLEAVIYDDEGDATKCVNMVKKLIDKDNVLAIVGPSLSGNTFAVMPVVEENQVPLISCAASVKITSPVNKWVFKTPQTDVLAVERIYEYLKSQGITKIAIMTVSNGYGDSGKEQLKAQAPGAGIEIVAEESFGEKDEDMTAQLTKIKGSGAGAIVCWGTNPGPAIVAKNIKQLGITIPLIQSHGVASPKYLEYAGDAANGNVLPTGKILVLDQLPESDVQRPVLLEYKTKYEDAFKMPVSGFGGYAWDAMGIIANALKESGADRAKLRDAIEKTTDYVGVSGIFTMTPEDHNGLTKDAFVMVIIENGTWKIIP
jgi:branched-chain amino acid transport system substrate-binding protein